MTTLVVLFVFLYVKPLFGTASAMFAAFLFSFTPYFVCTSHDLLTDVPALAFMLAAMWLFDLPDARYAVLSGVVAALSVQTRFTSLFVFVYFALDAILSPRKVRSMALLAVGAFSAIAPYLIWIQEKYGNFLLPFIIARRIVTEWTAPVPHRFYYDALLHIFPISMLLLFGLGVLLAIAPWVRQMRTGDHGILSGCRTGICIPVKRQLVLFVWGLAFFAYMLSIPHKEIRYLLPLAIPVVVISTIGLADLFRWFSRQTRLVRISGLLLGIAMVILDYASPFQKLMEPWVNQSASDSVTIAQYLREVSKPDDTIYAAHDFPVLAFYSERRTISLLPIQDNFDEAWSDFMSRQGFFVFFNPSGIKETHSRNPSFKPDLPFLETSPNFRIVRVFPHAVVYRYDPPQGKQGVQNGGTPDSTSSVAITSRPTRNRP